MSSTSSPIFDASRPRTPHDNVRQLVSNAFSVLDQPPPPTLREILTAYRMKGDGDREMLLAMLNAKASEDQRIASVASLQRSLLDAYQIPWQERSCHSTQPQPHSSHHYPTPSFTQSPRLCDRKSRRQHHHYHHLPMGTRASPRVHHQSGLPPLRDVTMYQDYPSRKRHRTSLSPPLPHSYEIRSNSRHSSQHEHLPPSPYSSSGRSDSAEYSPRSRTSMAIGSLLSSGPCPDPNTED
ncbi:hypothetical protein H2248_000522 [Termitomyces sp. 'cryptogamus']|nr:hypothetical protein H2248_000522 [Termitomyces sp. 'cryptogamus']